MLMLTMDELVTFQLESAAHWRRNKAEEYPNDRRNIDAAVRLEQLALEVRKLEGTEIHRHLLGDLGGDDGFFTEVLGVMSRSVGFSYFPESGEQFVEGIFRALNLRSGFDKTHRPLQQMPAISLQLLVAPGPKVSAGRLIEAVAVPWFDIIALLAKDERAAYEIAPEKWEEIVAGAYTQAGFDEVILTPRSGDFGRDIIATKQGLGHVRVIDQVKAYKPPHLVTANDVRALIGVLQSDGASKGFLTTTSSFAPRIKKDPLILPWIPSRLDLIDGKMLIARLRTLAGLGEHGTVDR